jgi:calcium-dependent protein kinase
MRKDKISKNQSVRLKYEIDILKNLDHPNILKLYEVYEDKQNIYLVTEFCSGGELFDEIIAKGRFEEHEAAFIMKQLFSAIAYCHSKNVCHRDLKPENILLDANDKRSIKLIDFGTSQVYTDEEKMEVVIGTSYYIAPEVLAGKYTEKCDMWSLGVILYILLSGQPPFPGENEKEIIAKVKIGKYEFRSKLKHF